VEVKEMFSYFYSVKNYTIAIKSTATEAREKLSTYLEFSELMEIFTVHLTKF